MKISKKRGISVNMIATYVTIIFILISPFENILRIEKIYYLLGTVILLLCILEKKSIKKNYSLMLPLFLLYAVVTTIWSPNKNALSDMFTLIVVFLFLYLQIQFDYTNNDFNKIKVAFIIQGGIMVILCSMFGKYMDGRFWLQSATSGADPNYLSGWFIIPICFIVEKMVNSSVKTIYKLLMIIEVAGFFYFIMESASRSGLITNALALGLSILYVAKKNIKKHPIKFLIMIVIFICTIIIGIQNMPETMLARLASSNGNLGGRSAIWKQLWSAINNTTYGIVFGMGSGSVTYFNAFHMAAHNTFFDVLFQYGLVGIGFLLLYVVAGMKKMRDKDAYIVISFISMAIMIFTLSALSTRFVMLTLFIIGANFYCKENK